MRPVTSTGSGSSSVVKSSVRTRFYRPLIHRALGHLQVLPAERRHRILRIVLEGELAGAARRGLAESLIVMEVDHQEPARPMGGRHVTVPQGYRTRPSVALGVTVRSNQASRSGTGVESLRAHRRSRSRPRRAEMASQVSHTGRPEVDVPSRAEQALDGAPTSPP